MPERFNCHLKQKADRDADFIELGRMNLPAFIEIADQSKIPFDNAYLLERLCSVIHPTDHSHLSALQKSLIMKDLLDNNIWGMMIPHAPYAFDFLGAIIAVKRWLKNREILESYQRVDVHKASKDIAINNEGMSYVAAERACGEVVAHWAHTRSFSPFDMGKNMWLIMRRLAEVPFIKPHFSVPPPEDITHTGSRYLGVEGVVEKFFSPHPSGIEIS